MSNPSISIITIVLNQAQALEKTILNVLQQAYEPLEYIIIDGGSIDGTLEVIEKYRDQISQVISGSDINTSDAMNKGIRASHGEIIGMIFAGDSYVDDILPRIALFHRQHPGAILHGNLHYWRESGQSDHISTARDDSEKAISINHFTAFVPLAVYETVGIYNLNFGHANDYEFYLRAKVAGMPFFYINETIANMTLGGNSDRNWVANYKEITKARILHGQGYLPCQVRFYFMLLRTIIRKTLEKMGADCIIQFYQYYVSPIRKYRS
ncbi:MAG: glycosyltransferase [Spirulina sp. SIO3F2]|nr:glycosyltransferase [Spirulina sp. SIO3F2]